MVEDEVACVEPQLRRTGEEIKRRALRGNGGREISDQA
jgi:hypothetical protein